MRPSAFAADPPEVFPLDPRVMKAGVAMAIGMTLLIPTFNAINNSYIEVSQPPPWIPSQLPENLQPPDHVPTPPPDWQPPEDWNPPPEWKDWKPPEDWEGKFEGQPPPGWDQGQCPPPVVKRAAAGNLTLTGTSPFLKSAPFEVPEYTAAVQVNVTFTGWVAEEIRARVDHPPGMVFGDEKSRPGTRSGGIGELASEPTRSPDVAWNWTYDPRQHDDQMPKSGQYTIQIEADPARDSLSRPRALEGGVRYSADVLLPCGGAFQ